MLTTGTRGNYRWLTTDEDDLNAFLRKCFHFLAGRYAAITSCDSGSYLPSENEKAQGWRTRDGITYSPKIESLTKLPTDGFNEWYVFNSPVHLGQLHQDNVFEATLAPGHVWAFVNFGGFELHNSKAEDLISLFWKQLDWIEPEFYVADGCEHLTFATANDKLFAGVVHALQSSTP